MMSTRLNYFENTSRYLRRESSTRVVYDRDAIFEKVDEKKDNTMKQISYLLSPVRSMGLGALYV